MENDTKNQGRPAERPFEKNNSLRLLKREFEINRKDAESRRAEGFVRLFEKLATGLGRQNEGGVRE